MKTYDDAAILRVRGLLWGARAGLRAYCQGRRKRYYEQRGRQHGPWIGWNHTDVWIDQDISQALDILQVPEDNGGE
jgi:hypothetical protein